MYCGHVAAGRRRDDREHPVEDRVAGEQHPLLVEEEAEVVRRVAGRVQHLEPELGAVDRVAVGRARGRRAPTARACEYAETSAPVAFASRVGAGRVVGMRVGEHTQRTRSRIDAADDRVGVPLRRRGRDRSPRPRRCRRGTCSCRARSCATGSSATMRRTSGDSALGTSGVMSAAVRLGTHAPVVERGDRPGAAMRCPPTSATRRSAPAGRASRRPHRRRAASRRGREARQQLEVLAGREDEVDVAAVGRRRARRPAGPTPTRQSRCRRAGTHAPRARRRGRTRCRSGGAARRRDPVRDRDAARRRRARGRRLDERRRRRARRR